SRLSVLSRQERILLVSFLTRTILTRPVSGPAAPGRERWKLVWCLTNNYTFVALKLAWGEARGRECILSDTRPTEQRSPRPISAHPEGRHVFWAEALCSLLTHPLWDMRVARA